MTVQLRTTVQLADDGTVWDDGTIWDDGTAWDDGTVRRHALRFAIARLGNCCANNYPSNYPLQNIVFY